MTLEELQQQALALPTPKRWQLVNTLLQSLLSGDPGQETDDEFPESHHHRQRRREEMFQEFPSMRDDPDADYWMDLANELGCDPETLRANLD